MPSVRRVKAFTVLVFLAAIALLFYTASVRQSHVPDSRSITEFYDRTVNALNIQNPNLELPRRERSRPGNARDDDEEVAQKMAESLKEAAQQARDNANAKAARPDPPSDVVGKGSAQEGAGRSIGNRRQKFAGAADQEAAVQDVPESEEDLEVEAEINLILKKSPVIIFSKSYCPHSKRAKNILMNKYTLDPAPYVVELDLHPLGPAIQAYLARLTGRRTVPNVLVNAVSIGGGEDVAELDASAELPNKIRELAGKKIKDIKLRPVANEDEPDLK